MTWLVLVAGLFVPVPGALSSHAARRLPRRAWATVALAGLVSAALYSMVGLALLSAPVVLPLIIGSSAAETCRVLLQRLEPGGVATSWAAAMLLGSAVAVATARRWRSRRHRAILRVPSYLGVHEQRGLFDLVTVPTSTALAYSVDGAQPQAVVSTGLRSRLGEANLCAVVAHEAAHLRWHHQRWLDAADLAVGLMWFVPWTRRSAAAVRVALECWADEEAATATGRETLRNALLIAVDAAPVGGNVAALNGADTIAQRVAMLDRPCAGWGRGWPAMAVLLALCAATTAIGIVGVVAEAPQLVALFTHLCPL